MKNTLSKNHKIENDFFSGQKMSEIRNDGVSTTKVHISKKGFYRTLKVLR